MADIEVRHTGQHSFEATNDRGASVRIGRKDQPGSFSPVELLLAAAAGCAAVTAETLITRRVGDGFTARAGDVRPEGAHQLDEVPVTLDYDLSALDEDQRATLETAVRRAVEQLCTVTRTLKKATPAPLHLPASASTTRHPPEGR
ncbi:OsmC family protein [Saccharothrix coeruleofusca]|uniref:Osmotically inducible protein C n=1 Tax=Saccharothrix coeruleofusca TaxID=33919 RepID=A0A918AIZ9_9PSEU|nr:OsmC family protein [Saccharothrix coeruleofusca]MBP2333996.1 putative OsmC-like protein [Saccharothrix coeruleofusca]GGP44184.1 osmotically inducible protein C [Saccharothrix coeruleofusca]